jgi:hypothetical protein
MKILFNGRVGPPHSTPKAALHSSDNASKKNDNYASDGNTSEHHKTIDPSIELYRTSNNFSTGTEMIVSMHSGMYRTITSIGTSK